MLLLFTMLNPEIGRSTNQMFDETAFTKDVIRLILPLGISAYSRYLWSLMTEFLYQVEEILS